MNGRPVLQQYAATTTTTSSCNNPTSTAFTSATMSLIQDKLGNEFLRSNGGMDPNFQPASMLMFSHLPPVTSFTRLASQSVMGDLQQEMILKKERDSPDHGASGGFLHGMGIKQEKLSELDYRLPLYGASQSTGHHITVAGGNNTMVQGGGVGGKGAGTMDMLDMSLGNHQNMLLHDLSLSNFSGRLGKEPKEGTGRRGKKANGEGNEGKGRRKRGDAAKSLMLDGDGGPMSPNCKPHICEHCNAAFRSSYHLRRHVLIHTGERPFRCSQCNMSFIQKYLLQRHEKIHSGEKPFSCDQCNMRFIQKYHMERHKRTHSGEKPYKCDNCQQYFSRTDRLLKHKRTCEEAIKKGLDPSMLDLGEDDLGQGSYLLTQGNPPATAPSGGRKRGRGKGEGGGERRRKKAASSSSSSLHMPRGLGLQDYGGGLPSASGDGDAGGPSSGGGGNHMGRTPKLVFKKAGRNKGGLDKSLLSMADDAAAGGSNSGLHNQKLSGGGGGMDGLGLMQGSGGPKQPGTSSNYDDAMQFLKKRRYLNAANSGGAGGSGVGVGVGVGGGGGGNQQNDFGHLPPPQQTIIQTGLPGEPTLALLDTSPLISVDKHDKSGIPDEVLQSLLDHYSHKPDGSHHHHHHSHHHNPHHHHHHHDDVTFDLSGHHVDLQPAEVVGHDDEGSPGGSGDKTVVMSEYSKFLLQTLERTSHSSGFPLGPSAPFPTLLTTSSPSSSTLFSDKHVYATSPLDCGYTQPVGSPLGPSSSSSSSGGGGGTKSHYSMLVSAPSPNSHGSQGSSGASQGGYHLSSLEPASHQQLTPSQELDQLEKQHSPPFQLTSDMANGGAGSAGGPKDGKNGGGNGSAGGGNSDGGTGAGTNGNAGNGPVYPDLAPLEPSKEVDLRSTYQIENFAQAFGAQFKSGRGTPLSAYGGGADDHRLPRTTVSEFSGYTSLLADVGEPASSGSKTPTSQSYR
ncbi:zinc finger protein 281b [Sardina pilchardus]|uniref:zinc finger protein 281b n=1 Tax=Sardina pilchardus TaxID=27697 RepID=UPI002E15CE56